MAPWRPSVRPAAFAVVLAAAVALSIGGCGDSSQGPGRHRPSSREVVLTSDAHASPPARAAAASRVAALTLRLVDRRRRVTLPGGARTPRRITTVVLYPRPRPAKARIRYPLVVFGHGFALTPRPYGPLLRAWARAGYVVAAPVFPREAATAAGGPDRRDLVNQPADVRFVIGQLLRLSGRSSGRLRGSIDPARIAVAGHSDGGDTAIAVAYDPRFRDRRVRAAVVLAGATIPAAGTFAFPRSGPPLLAVQGTADTVNPPADTLAYYRQAPRPKLRLSLLGAGHFAPYMSDARQLRIVERVSTAFLDRYLKGRRIGPSAFRARGSFRGRSRLQIDP